MSKSYGDVSYQLPLQLFNHLKVLQMLETHGRTLKENKTIEFNIIKCILSGKKMNYFKFLVNHRFVIVKASL